MALVDEGVHRQQLDAGDAQALQVLDGRRGAQPRIAAAQRLGHARMAHRVALDVHLVDDHLVRGHVGAPVVAPAEGRVDHPALGHVGGAVASVEGQVGLLVADHITVQGVVPAQPAGEVPGVGVDQQLVCIETQPVLGPVRPMHTIAVDQAGPCLRQVAVPDVVGLLAQLDALALVAAPVEQAQLHALGLRREQREVDAMAVPGGTARMRAARPQLIDRDLVHHAAALASHVPVSHRRPRMPRRVSPAPPG